MPNNRNAEKAVRQTEKRRLRNRASRTALKTVIRKAEETATGEAAAAQASFRDAIKKIDQSAAKHLIHANKAARDKSRLTKLINKLSAAPAPAAGEAAAK